MTPMNTRLLLLAGLFLAVSACASAPAADYDATATAAPAPALPASAAGPSADVACPNGPVGTMAWPVRGRVIAASPSPEGARLTVNRGAAHGLSVCKLARVQGGAGVYDGVVVEVGELESIIVAQVPNDAVAGCERATVATQESSSEVGLR